MEGTCQLRSNRVMPYQVEAIGSDLALGKVGEAGVACLGDSGFLARTTPRN